jgi:hypothetical protein
MIMNKKYLLFFLLINCSLLYGQHRVISIDPKNTKVEPLNLSEIAESLTPIALEKPCYGTQNIFLTSEYLFTAGISSVCQYDVSGKYIRTIKPGGFILNNVSADTVNKVLYVPLKNELKSYDFAGNLLKTFKLESFTLNCFYHKGKVWLQSCELQEDLTVDYKLSYLDVSTGENIFIPVKIQDKDKLKYEAIIMPSGYFSLYKNTLVTSFGLDSALYQIQENQLNPIIRWNIKLSGHALEYKSNSYNGIIGKYLFIAYKREGQDYIYLENLKDNKKYHY